MRTHQLALDAENRGQRTRERYRLVLDRYGEFIREKGNAAARAPIPLTALSNENARAFVLWLRTRPSENPLTHSVRKVSAKTIREYASSLKSFTHFCVAEGMLETDPLTRFKLPTAPSRIAAPFTVDEIHAMLRVIDRHPMASRNKALLYLLVSTGMRASELCGLKMVDVEPLSARKAKVMGKGSKERYVYFDRGTQRALSAAVNGTTNGPLFLTRDKKPLRRHALYQLVHDWGEEAGIEGAHPHRFRHTFAVAYLRAHPGALLHLQLLLGHSTLEMVRRYARLAETETPLDGPSPLEQMGIR